MALGPFDAWAGGVAEPDLLTALQSSLDALLVFYAEAKLAHWNVRGPLRMPLHEKFGALADAASEHADVVAERLVQLGGVVAPTRVEVAPYESNDGLALARDVTARVATATNALVAAQQAAEAEPETVDVLVQALRELEKHGADVALHLA